MGGTSSVSVAPSPAAVRIFFWQEDGKQRCYPKDCLQLCLNLRAVEKLRLSEIGCQGLVQQLHFV